MKLEPAEAPMDMGRDYAWFTAFDPSGLPVEFVGQERP